MRSIKAWNLQGHHVLILLAVVVVIIAITIIVVVVSVRWRSAWHSYAVHCNPVSRIEQLSRLRDQGMVNSENFEAKRRKILREM